MMFSWEGEGGIISTAAMRSFDNLLERRKRIIETHRKRKNQPFPDSWFDKCMSSIHPQGTYLSLAQKIIIAPPRLCDFEIKHALMQFFFRFLKKIQDPSVWEEVNDETAREKASQVLRDAVGGLLEPKDEADESVQPLPTVSAPTSLDEQDQLGRTRRRHIKVGEDSNEYSPPYRTFRQPEPALASKRRRYSEGTSHYQTSDVAYVPYPEQHSTAVPVGYSPLRRHSEESYRSAAHSDPTGHRSYYYHQSQPLHYPYNRHFQPANDFVAHHTRSHSGNEFVQLSQSHSSLLGDIHQNLNVSETVNEFDLFNGELLESDVEGEDPAISGSYNRNVRR
jgi:hypothetical protein